MQEFDSSRTEKLSKDDFCRLYESVIQEKIVRINTSLSPSPQYTLSPLSPPPYTSLHLSPSPPLQVLEKFHSFCCRDKKTLGFKELQNFLKTAQEDVRAEDPSYVLDVFSGYAQVNETSGKHSKKPSVSITLHDVSWYM